MIESTAQPQTHNTEKTVNPALRGVLRLFLIVATPIVLVLISVRIVMSPLFLELEYNRAGFPEDEYGFTTEDRLYYAPFALEYLLNDADISYLGDLTFPDGSALYNASELRHMEDVKVVTRAAYFILITLLVVFALTGILVWRRKSLRADFKNGLFTGALFTICLIVSIIFFAIFAWNLFFDTFHNLFFESGTWRFAYSDTLIRLFPEQFWFDAAIVIGSLSLGSALVIMLAMWQWGKRLTS